MRHLIRVGVGCFSVGVEAREGQRGNSGLRHLHHFAQQGVSHLSWAQRSRGPPHQITRDHTWLDTVIKTLSHLPPHKHTPTTQS